MFATLSNLLRALLPQPQTYGDYYRVHGWLIYKKLVAILVAGLLILLLAFGIWMSFWLHARQTDTTIPVFYVLDEALKEYTGQVIVVDVNRDTLYQGEVAQGLRTGQGTAYQQPGGEVVYVGGFLEDRYSDAGRAYRQGWLLYEGMFAKGLYHGSGTLYASDSCVQYRGQFVDGAYQGAGVLYHPDGRQTLYDGGFAAGLFEGTGTLYRADGTVRYEGDFHKGRFHGVGTEYTEQGAAVYEGMFKDGLRNGAGSLYSPDGVRLVFQGQFVQGEPARNGKLFNRQGQLLYDGSIFNGQPDYLSLLGLPMAELQTRVAELPVIYYGDGTVGYLYRELGFAVLCKYDYASERALDADAFGDFLLQQAVRAEESTENLGGGQAGDDASRIHPDTGMGTGDALPEEIALFASPQDNLVADTMLVTGARIWEQVPVEQGISVQRAELTGFEAFLESRVAGIEDPTARLAHQAQVLRRGDHLYEVVGSGPPVAYDGVGHYQDTVSYYYRGKALEKGAVPAVVLCCKARLGG